MRTADLFGNTTSAYLAQAARRAWEVSWDFRIVDENGRVWPLPPRAVRSRNRSSQLDGGTWQVSLEVVKSRLPAGLTIRKYHQLQIDRLSKGTWPYFRGIIDQVDEGHTMDGGAVVGTLQLSSYGMLQKAKGYRLNVLRFDPDVTGLTARKKMLGVLTTQRVRMESAVTAGNTEQLPAAVIWEASQIKISPNSDMSSPYTAGVNYSIDTSTFPATITAITNLAGPHYVQFYRAERFVVARWSADYWYKLPVGRGPDDLYHTTVASFNQGTKKVTPADPTGYKSMLDLSQFEYLVFNIGGTDEAHQITAVNATTGEMTLATFPPSGVAAGTPIRLGTVEYHSAWDEDRDIRFWTAAGGGSEYPSPRIVAYPTNGLAIPYPTQVAHAYWVNADAVFGSDELKPIQDQNVDPALLSGLWTNRVEEFTRLILSAGYVGGVTSLNPGAGYTSAPTVSFSGGGGTGAAAVATVVAGGVSRVTMTSYGTGYTSAPTVSFSGGGGAGASATAVIIPAGTSLYTADQIQVTPMGVLMKNLAVAGVTLDEMLRRLKEASLPPNGFIRDNPDGTIAVRTYQQAATASWEIRGATSIRITDHAEPVTAVTVIGKAEATDMAGTWFTSSTGLNDPRYAVDGTGGKSGSASVAGSIGSITFTVPAETPLQVFPSLESMTIQGQGLVTVYAQATTGGTVYYIPGFLRKALGDGSSGSVTLSADDLLKASAPFAGSAYRLVVVAENNTATSPAIPGKLASIKIMVSRQTAWRAALSDQASLTTIPADTSAFGAVWKAPDTSKRESYRYAPEAYLRRVLSQYSASNPRHRHEVRELDGIGPQAARAYAEALMDEYLRASQTYEVTAPINDLAELGDTVRLWLPDGTSRNLFLWGLSDGGSPADNMATYSLRDYSL